MNKNKERQHVERKKVEESRVAFFTTQPFLRDTYQDFLWVLNYQIQ